MTTVLFGHRDTPDTVKENLKQIISHLIQKENARHFLVGNEGNFDRLAQRILKELSEKSPTVEYSVVLAYLPKEGSEQPHESQTIYPEGLELVPRRFAISKRNSWMLEKADIAVFYVTAPIGNSYQLMKKAKAKGKKVINMADFT